MSGPSFLLLTSQIAMSKISPPLKPRRVGGYESMLWLISAENINLPVFIYIPALNG